MFDFDVVTGPMPTPLKPCAMVPVAPMRADPAGFACAGPARAGEGARGSAADETELRRSRRGDGGRRDGTPA